MPSNCSGVTQALAQQIGVGSGHTDPWHSTGAWIVVSTCPAFELWQQISSHVGLHACHRTTQQVVYSIPAAVVSPAVFHLKACHSRGEEAIFSLGSKQGNFNGCESLGSQCCTLLKRPSFSVPLRPGHWPDAVSQDGTVWITSNIGYLLCCVPRALP